MENPSHVSSQLLAFSGVFYVAIPLPGALPILLIATSRIGKFSRAVLVVILSSYTAPILTSVEPGYNVGSFTIDPKS